MSTGAIMLIVLPESLSLPSPLQRPPIWSVTIARQFVSSHGPQWQRESVSHESGSVSGWQNASFDAPLPKQTQELSSSDVGASQWLSPLFRRHSLLSLLHSQSPAVTVLPSPSVAQPSQPSALQPGPGAAMAERARHNRRRIDPLIPRRFGRLHTGPLQLPPPTYQ